MVAHRTLAKFDEGGHLDSDQPENTEYNDAVAQFLRCPPTHPPTLAFVPIAPATAAPRHAD